MCIASNHHCLRWIGLCKAVYATVHIQRGGWTPSVSVGGWQNLSVLRSPNTCGDQIEKDRHCISLTDLDMMSSCRSCNRQAQTVSRGKCQVQERARNGWNGHIPHCGWSRLQTSPMLCPVVWCQIPRFEGVFLFRWEVLMSDFCQEYDLWGNAPDIAAS